MADIVAYIGLDWGDARHSVHLQTGDGTIEHVELEQKPDVLHAWVAQLKERFAGGQVAIALEQRKGAVVNALMLYDFLVLYPINPKALARDREAFRTSGAKDDPGDSQLLLDLVVRHRDKLRAWMPDTVEARTLQFLCEQRRKLVNHRVALTNRLTSLLKQYFPQALEWVGDLASPQACDFLTQWPNLGALQQARPSTVRKFYPQLPDGLRHRGAPRRDQDRSGPDERPSDRRAAQPRGPDLCHAIACADPRRPDV